MGTAMATHMVMDMLTHMSTNLSPIQLMTVTQWLSPGFPVGAFSYSHGLEAAFHAEPDLRLEPYLTDLLRHGAGRNDVILLRAGYAGQQAEADALGRALAPSQERLLEITQLGTAFCTALRGSFDLELGDLIYPVAIGAAAREKAMPLEPVCTLFLHAYVANLIAAAQRLSPLGQREAQAMLDRLNPVCAEVASATSGCGLDNLGSSAWLADIDAMRHETQDSRIFRT